MLRTSIPARRLLVGATTAVAALLALSGCFRIDMAVTVHEDDTVDGTAIIAVDKSVLSMTGGTIDDLVPDDAMSGDTVVEPYAEGDLVGKKFTLKTMPLSKFNEDDDSESGSDLTIQHIGDTFVLDGTFDSGADDAGGTGAADLPDASVRFAFTFPGDVVEANGQIDEDTNTVTWSPKDLSAPLDMHAVAKDEPSSSIAPWMLYAGGGLALLVVLGVVVVIVRRSRREAEVVAPMFAYHPGTGAPAVGAYASAGQPGAPTPPTGWGPPQQ